jgi:hypothetical protein
VLTENVKVMVECGTERVVAKVVDYYICSVPIQLYHPLLPGIHFIFLSPSLMIMLALVIESFLNSVRSLQ